MAYTNIDDPSAYFQTAIYSGSNSDLTVTNDGNSDLKPDWLWIKQRSSTENHMVVDSTRGVTKYLSTDSNGAEATVTSRVETLDTDGFTLNGASNPVNASGATYVGWQWKANGGTTSSNTDGSITSTVQANTDAGFSIVTYTGTGSAATIGHGLGVKPDIIIFKRRNGTNNWDFQFKGEARLTLNLTDAQATNVLCTFTSTTTDLGSVVTNEKNANGGTYVAYCFASKQGYSKFGSYVGNGNDNGPFIYTGFKPAFVLTKGTNASQWRLYDSARSPNNVNINRLFPYSSSAEATDTDAGIDMLSNGFKIRGSGGDYNANGTKYIYMAFADNPFTTSTGIPTTAR